MLKSLFGDGAEFFRRWIKAPEKKVDAAREILADVKVEPVRKILSLWQEFKQKCGVAKPGLGTPRRIDLEGLSVRVAEMVRRTSRGWVTRNSKCPCGSFKRFKRCCMLEAAI